MTMRHVDENNPGMAALLHTGDVANCFKRMDLCSYGKARRRFYDEVNLNPFKRYPKGVSQLIEWAFEDWFAFDCSIVGMSEVGGDTGADSTGQLRFELDHGCLREHKRIRELGWQGAYCGACSNAEGKAGHDDVACGERKVGAAHRIPPHDGDSLLSKPGVSPYVAAFAMLNDGRRGELGPRAERDVDEVDETNFASMFWVRGASASTGRMRVDDLLHGGSYELLCPPLAAEYDGACGGMIANRIARSRGAWRPCGIALYEARRPDEPEVGESLARFFREGGWKPDFPGMVRLFYGRSKDTGLDWADTEALMRMM